MDADRDAVPDDIAALKEALAVERAKALEDRGSIEIGLMPTIQRSAV